MADLIDFSALTVEGVWSQACFEGCFCFIHNLYQSLEELIA